MTRLLLDILSVKSLLIQCLLQFGDMWIKLGQRETLMLFCNMDKVIFVIPVDLIELLNPSLKADN